MLRNLLKRKNMNINQLSKASGIRYGYLYKIINNQTTIDNCGLGTAKKLADALDISLDDLYEYAQNSYGDEETSFDAFRSNLQHMIKEDEESTIIYIVDNEVIPYYMKRTSHIRALYALAVLDYLCKKNGYGIVSDYDEYRDYKLKERFYPNRTSEIAEADLMPEFLKYNICEVSLNDVC